MCSELLLAKKYALAFLNVYSQKLSADDYPFFARAAEEIKKYHQLMLLLESPYIKEEKKQQCLSRIIENYHLPKFVDRVTNLLITHQRTTILPLVFKQIARLITEEKKVLPITIRSSIELNKEAIAIIEKFIQNKTSLTIVSQSIVDESLIAGLRIESSSYLWEYSISQQLRHIKNGMTS